MTISTAENKLLVLETNEREGDAAVMLETYVKLHNDQLRTLEWMEEHKFFENDSLNRNRNEWGDRVKALRQVSLAIDAGFDPFTPPTAWNHGPLARYLGPIPAQVLDQIAIALPIFGKDKIIIHDPRPNRFQQLLDPIATGVVKLEDDSIHFLIGQWDLDQDLKLINELPDPADALTQARQALKTAAQRWQ